MALDPSNEASSDIHEPYSYPTKEERIAIRKAQPLLKSLLFPSNTEDKTFEDPISYLNNHDFNAWQVRFNNKLNKLDFSYVLAKYYFNRGIPDEEWKVELDNGTTRFFPNLRSIKDRTNLFLFRYAAENFYYHYTSSSDIVYHLLNSYFGLDIESKYKFNSTVIKKLKNEVIKKVLNEFNEKTEEFRLDRNNLAHNFPFYEIDIRSERQIDNGRGVISLGVYKYTPSKQVIDNIEDSLKPLAELIDVLKQELT